MPQLIDVPGEGQVEFPDSMSDEEIGQAIQKRQAAAVQLVDVPGEGAVEFPASMSDEEIGQAIQKRQAAAVQLVDVPGEGAVEFPASMSDEEIGRVIKKRGLETELRQTRPPPPGSIMVGGDTTMVDATALGAPLRGMGHAGRVMKGAATDFIAGATAPESQFREPLRNAKAAAAGEELPDAHELGPFATGVTDAFEGLPLMAAATAGTVVTGGVTAPLWFGGLMGGKRLAEGGTAGEAAKEAAVGAILPFASKLGGAAMGKVIAKGVQSGVIGAESTVMQKALEAIGHQAGMMAAMEVSQLPDYVKMTPAERKDAFVRSLGANLALGVTELPAFAKGVPSEYQRGLLLAAHEAVGEAAPVGTPEVTHAETRRGPEGEPAVTEESSSTDKHSLSVQSDHLVDANEMVGEGYREPGIQEGLVDVPARPVPAGEIVARPDLMQFKKQEDTVTGTNEADTLAEPSAGQREMSLDPAAIAQSTLPRRLDSGVEQPVAGEPIGPTEIRQYLSKALDIPVRLGVNGKQVFGFFRRKPEAIRLKMINDLPTLAHEVGHYLHKILAPGPNPHSAGTDAYGDFGGVHDTELLALGSQTSKPSYTKQQVRMEGVAEATRLWLTDPAQAMAAAPGFTMAWEAAIKAKDPVVYEILRNGQKQIHQYIQQPGPMQLRAHISRGEQYEGLPLRERISKLYDNWVTELAPLERSMKYLQKLGLPADQAKGVVDNATNYIGGVANQVEATMKHEQRDYAGRRVGPSYREIMAKVPEHDSVGLGDYMVARRVLELHAQGKQTGMTTQQATETVTKFQQMEPSAEALWRFQKNNLRLLVDAGVISEGQVKAMEASNRDYVPFYRVVENLRGGSGGANSAKGFVDLPQGVGRFKGSDLKIVDPLESIIKNLWVFRDLAERNRVGVSFVDAVNATTGGGRVADSVAKKIKPTEVSHAEVSEYLKKMGLVEEVQGENGNWSLKASSPNGQPLALANDLGFLIWKATRTESAAKGIFKVWRKGAEEFYQLEDADLYRSLNLADSSDAQFMSKVPFVGFLRGVTRVFRTGATVVPEFIARNLMRDQWTAAVYSQTGMVPLYDSAKMLFDAAKRTDLYWDWRHSGGGHGELTGGSRKSLQEALAAEVKDPSALKQALQWVNPMSIVKGLQRASQIVEEATRLAEFKRAKATGVAAGVAANMAKDLTLNFNRAGFHGKMVNQLWAFFNAGIQDLDKFGREHKWVLDGMMGKSSEEAMRRGMTVAAKAMAYITLPSAVAWWLGKDDEKIQALPAWRKNFFWNVNFGRLLGGEGEDFILTVPKPFLLGQVYGSGLERALDYYTKRDPNAAKHFVGGLFTQLPVSVDNLMVTAGRSVVENIANHSFFADRPLETVAQQKLPPFMRSNVTTSETAKQLAKLGDMYFPEWATFSPIKFDNTVRGFTAGLGAYGSAAIDYALGKIKALDIPPRPAKEWSEMPVLKGLSVGPYAPSADVQRFYQGLNKAEERNAAFDAMAPNLTGKFEANWWLRNQGAYAHYVSGNLETLRSLQESMGQFGKAMKIIQESRTIDPADKAKRLKNLVRARDQVAKQGVALLWPGDRKKVY